MSPLASLTDIPRISVAMTTFNGAAHVEEPVESMLGQSRLPDELIVCDDGSTDMTVEILAGCAKRAPFPVTINRKPSRLGSTGNFEQAITLCAVKLGDQDDVWLPDMLAALAEALDANPATGLAFSNAELVGEGLEPLARNPWSSVGLSLAHVELVRRGKADDLLLPNGVVQDPTQEYTNGMVHGRPGFSRFSIAHEDQQAFSRRLKKKLQQLLGGPE